MVWSTGSPEGTMIQMARGAERFLTRSSSESTPSEPAAVSLAVASSVEVEADDLVAGEAEALRHVEAHLAETNDSKFHDRAPSYLCCVVRDVDSELSEVAGELIRRLKRMAFMPKAAAARQFSGLSSMKTEVCGGWPEMSMAAR